MWNGTRGGMDYFKLIQLMIACMHMKYYDKRISSQLSFKEIFIMDPFCLQITFPHVKTNYSTIRTQCYTLLIPTFLWSQQQVCWTCRLYRSAILYCNRTYFNNVRRALSTPFTLIKCMMKLTYFHHRVFGARVFFEEIAVLVLRGLRWPRQFRRKHQLSRRYRFHLCWVWDMQLC